MAVDREDMHEISLLIPSLIRHTTPSLFVSTMARFAQLGMMLLAARVSTAFVPVAKTFGTRAVATSSILKASDSDFDDYKAEVSQPTLSTIL